MIGFLKRLFTKRESLDDLPPIQAGSQQAIDTEARNFILPSLGILPPYNLQNYLDLYLTDDLAHGIVDADTDLTSSPLECLSESDELCSYLTEFHRRINLDRWLEQVIQDLDIYGFHVSEIVGNGSSLLDSTEILGLFRIDPRFVLIQKTLKGRFEYFRQRPGFTQTGGSTAFPAFEQRLDAQSIVYVRSTNPLTSYGLSMLQPITAALDKRSRLIQASVTAHENHSSPIIHLHYQDDPQRPENVDEIRVQKEALKTATETIDENKSRWLVSAGRGSYQSEALGHSTLPNSQALIDYLTASCIISAGLSPPGLGFILGKGVTSFESSSQQSITNIIAKQRSITAALSKLYRVLRLVEKVPEGEIIVRMEPPTSETLKEKWEAQSILVNYVDRLLRMGIVSPEQAARELGYLSVHDEQRLNDFISGQGQEPNENDPNDNQAIDAATRALSKGRDAGNNPTGGKG